MLSPCSSHGRPGRDVIHIKSAACRNCASRRIVLH
nr:MAG TPA: hypothetical protein [Caudoviricetes sp.]